MGCGHEMAPAPEREPQVLVDANKDTPVVLPKNIDDTVTAEDNVEPIQLTPQAPFVQLGPNEVQLELQNCGNYSLVIVSPGHLIVASTTSEGEPICFLIDTQLIPGLKGRDLTLNDAIQIGEFTFVIVVKG